MKQNVGYAVRVLLLSALQMVPPNIVQAQTTQPQRSQLPPISTAPPIGTMQKAEPLHRIPFPRISLTGQPIKCEVQTSTIEVTTPDHIDKLPAKDYTITNNLKRSLPAGTLYTVFQSGGINLYNTNYAFRLDPGDHFDAIVYGYPASPLTCTAIVPVR